MRLRTTFKLLLIVALAAFLYGGYIFNESRWGRKWQPADAILPNNMKYYGDLKDGLLEGPGELVGADGTHFKGSFHQGLMHGSGELSGPDFRYQGEFARGMFNGKGILEWTAGGRYEGEFKDDRAHGAGKLERRDGTSFEGEFADYQMIKGIFKDGFGGVYDGEMVDDMYHGKGIYTTENGDRFEGDFIAGSLTGTARITREDGSVYEGEVEDWVYQGKGTLTDADGNIYTGAFEYGSFHGVGELKLKEPVNGVDVLAGEWSHGELPDDPRRLRRIQAATIEKLLYSQNALIEQSIAGLAPQTPGQIDFYIVGVAGDGNQEIFLKELQFVQNLLARQLHTAQRQILLVNNRHTLEQYPLATRTSLARVVQGVESKLDPAEDIVVVYLTSHGSEDHKFYISMPGVRLPSVSKTDLAEILNPSNIQWKIVIVSACYSGGFIPDLQNEKSLVITAARHDRKSFGCDDANDMTYFARAFFRDSFAQTADFITAFDRAKNLVEEWENADFPDDDHSEPQIFVGEKIKAHLQAWAAQQAAASEYLLP